MEFNEEDESARAVSVKDKIVAYESKIQNMNQASSNITYEVFPDRPTHELTPKSFAEHLSPDWKEQAFPTPRAQQAALIRKGKGTFLKRNYGTPSPHFSPHSIDSGNIDDYEDMEIESKLLHDAEKEGVLIHYKDLPRKENPIHMFKSVGNLPGSDGGSSNNSSDDDMMQIKKGFGESQKYKRPVSMITFHSSKESDIHLTRKRSFSLPSTRIKYEAKSSKFQKKYRFHQRQFEDLMNSVEYLDCAFLCARSFNQHKHEISISIPTFGEIYVLSHELSEWIGKCNVEFAHSRSLECPCITSALCVLTSIEARRVLKGENGILNRGHGKRMIYLIEPELKILFQHAYENKNYILLAELVNMCEMLEEFSLKRFLQENIDMCRMVAELILVILKHRLVEKCQRFHELNFGLSLCYSNKDKQPVILLASEGIIETNIEIPKLFLGFDVLLYKYRQYSEESKLIFDMPAASPGKDKLPTMTERMARTLFSQHSNLYMIKASPCKSIGYSTRKHKVEHKVCFSLFCQHKGYIPHGEKEFPPKIGMYGTDVLEGYCSFGMDSSLEFGGHIRRKGGFSGSIGGFVNLPGDKLALMTCAHVLFLPGELVNGNLSNAVVETFRKSSHTFEECGKVVDVRFPISYKATDLESQITFENNVDVAIVELKLDPERKVNTFGFRAVPEDQLRLAGFDPECFPSFAGECVEVPLPKNSEKIQIQDITSDKIPGASETVIKFGATTGFTIGELFFNHTHARFHTRHMPFADISFKDRGPVMCNQLEIRNLPQGNFFDFGDSGSFVFCVNSDNNFICLGMAIGFSACGTFLVTPMDRILKSFEPPLTLKPSIPSVSEKAEIISALNKLDSRMESIEKQLNDLNKKLEESMNE